MSKKNPFLYKILKPTLGTILKLYFNPKIIGSENIPKEGPMIAACNHKHTFDQFWAIISIKRVVHYMAKKEYFDGTAAMFGKDTKFNCKLSKWIVENAGCISVDRSKKDTDAIESALEVLKSGGVVGLFPEGTRNKTDAFLLPFKFGVVSMASKTDAYILPIGLTGTYKFRSKDLIMRIGKPFKVGNMTLEEANEKLYNEIKNLMLMNIEQSRKELV